MSELDESYELKMLKMVVNNHLDKTTSSTEESLKTLESNRDKVVWELATKIYSQSGHKVELSLVRDVVDSRIRTIKYQQAEVKKRIAEEAHRVAEKERIAKEARHNKVTYVSEKFGGEERKAKVFVIVRKIISKQLCVDESTVTLDSRLSQDLRGDVMDLIELVRELEEEFDIEISDEDSDYNLHIGSEGGCWSWSSWSSSSNSSQFDSAGENCIVRNFVELICQKVSD